ncbi:outer membrane protein OmpA-like peptidoglycan-associated protein [Lipingzhangella halophila]|uniref:Outer membrane protein OmpA-like peptidoglycan-associated protein n=1 Tax=Lipingzhangella halophila TaxID=1783352 RepID=A0A7W7RLL5_9ACTN|nr:OmpA family protein [Lipingzhangella halophila]MBB4934247.1 outer membrane protein OmpA-like peptidoglycan-associated protein [Lipingzhangella halophila]
MAQRTSLGAVSVLATGGLLLSGCAVVDNLERFQDDNQNKEQEEEQQQEAPEPEFPYVKQGRIFLDTGDDVEMEYGIVGLESTDEYMVLDSYENVLEPLEGEVTDLTSPPRMVDSESGLVYEQLVDEENERAYGTYFEEDSPWMPIHEGAPQMVRRYFPPVPEDVETLTFTGSGMGAMTGIPVEHVDEISEQPEPNADEYIDPDTWDSDIPEGTEVYYPYDEPPADIEARPLNLEQFVHSDVASTTRSGDEETIALNADVMFEFDEAELTDEAEDVVQQAAESMRTNLGSDVEEITIVGHSDGKGSDDYNQTLSEERAETVQELLADDLGSDYSLTTEGRGSEEPIAEEGGSDDEEARAQNRRVEFTYKVNTGGGSEESEGGLDAAERHVSAPAAYNEDDGEIHESVTKDDVQLDVYPLTRDGAYLIGTVAFNNTTDEPVEPEIGGADAEIPGGPSQYNEGTLGGFVLSESDSDVVRYVSQLKLGEDEYEGFAEEVHELQPGEDYRTIAIFPAPSQDVEKMTLHAGEFGEIAGVPIR